MKTKSISKIVAGIFAFAVFGIANSEAAHEDRELVRLAHLVDDQAEDLRNEFKKHFRHSGSYRHLMSDIEGIQDDIAHIDKLAHHLHHESLLHVKKDIASLDKLVHHLTEVVEGVECGRYSGHIDGDTRHVKRLIASMNHTLHGMDDLVADALHGGRHEHHRGYGATGQSRSSWGQSWSRSSTGGRGDLVRQLLSQFASR